MMDDNAKTLLLQVSNAILLGLVSDNTNNSEYEEDENYLVKKSVRMGNKLIKEVSNFKLD